MASHNFWKPEVNFPWIGNAVMTGCHPITTGSGKATERQGVRHPTTGSSPDFLSETPFPQSSSLSGKMSKLHDWACNSFVFLYCYHVSMHLNRCLIGGSRQKKIWRKGGRTQLNLVYIRKMTIFFVYTFTVVSGISCCCHLCGVEFRCSISLNLTTAP